MEPSPRKLQQRTQEQTAHEQQSVSAQEQAIEFSSAEEMLRLDAEKIPVPPRIESRLREAIAREPAPQKSWWERLFRRNP